MQDELFNIDGQEYLRVRVEARMRLATGDKVPQGIKRAVAAKKDPVKPYWVDPDNPDLVWVNFILDSEGDNENWDYMPRSQLVASYKTARFKPLDMEHIIREEGSLLYLDKSNPSVKNTIFGGMTHAYLSDTDGNALTDKQIKALEKGDDPDRKPADRITVSAWAAMYYFLFPKTVKGMVEAIAEDEMKVSMERWLKTWDFLVREGDGWKEVPRATAETDGTFAKWQRRQQVGGGRILRRSLSFTYGGVAATTNPANKLSRFVDKTAADAEKAAASMSDPAVKILVERHDQVEALYAVSSNEAERLALTAEHLSIHKALRQLGVA
jgi:hypothetical protein